jgi:hypothetical protein
VHFVAGEIFIIVKSPLSPIGKSFGRFLQFDAEILMIREIS